MAVALPAVATALAGILIGTAIFLLLRKGGRAAPMEDATSGPSPAAAPGKPIESKHYAWAKDIKQREAEMRALGVDMSPQPVKVAEGAAPSSGAAAGVSRSAWNAAGTWEDRDISARALQTLRARLERFSAVMGDGTFSVTAVNSCTGSVNLAFVRGKAKPGYECSVTLAWALDTLAADGTLTLSEISDTDSDVWGDAAVAVTRGDAATASRAVRGVYAQLRAALREWAEELKAL